MRASLVAGLLTLFPASAWAQVNVRALSVVADPTVIAGQSIGLVVSFQSDGVQPMPAFRWRPYLTLGGALDTAIPLAMVGPITLGDQQPHVYTVTRPIPANVSGRFTVAIVADFDDVIVESNEYDNLAIASATTHVVAEAPDLVITAGNASATSLTAGANLDVGFTIQNRGQLDASVTVGAYLSRNPVVTPSDLLLGTADVTVPAGGSLGGSIPGVVPPDAHVGDYTVGVIADPAGLITEADETNNLFEAGRVNLFEDTIALDTESLPGGTLTIDYHVQLAASGGDGHYAYRLTAGALPEGLTLDTGGTLSGTPTRTGAFDFEIEVESRGLTASRAFSVEIVSTFQPLRIVTDSVDGGFHRYPYQQVLVAGGGEPPYHWRLTEGGGIIPPGLDLSTSGVISGIPSQLGHFSFGVTVSDRLGAIDSLLYEVEIVPLATVLILTTEQPVGEAGQPFDYTIQAIGGVPPYRWQAASTPPPGLSVTEDGHIAGTAEQFGVWPLRVRVTDSTTDGASDTALFQVDIRDTSDFHIVTESLPTGLVRSLLELPLEADGGTPPYQWSLGPGESLPDGFFLAQGDGTDYPTDTALIVGRAFRPLVHGFSLIVEDARGRTRQRPYAIVIEAGSGSLSSGCTCTGRPDFGAAGLVLGLLGVLIWRRRPRSR